MKLLLLTAGLVAGITCYAQPGNRPYLQKKSSVQVIPPGQGKNKKSDNTLSTNSYLLENGNSVIVLPQDNMPCIIPKQEEAIPNAGNNLKQKNWGAPIPNAGKAGITSVHLITPIKPPPLTDSLPCKN